ncbi:uncharacterized protein LOC133183177 [Saccostrea echinata]|uniref:uncharacterized protein LOC133183177 n=1 Tax=Saccostrea echinata TaxID=191078 RepID=UPI002A811370|nr:uncharacterized protein LOC133183177 [Saccostrea echinata]
MLANVQFLQTTRNALSLCRSALLNLTTGVKHASIVDFQSRHIQSLSSSFWGCQRRNNCCNVGQNNLLAEPCSTSVNQVRFLKQPQNPRKKLRYPYYKYRFSGWKRIHKFGLEARLSSISQKEILWKRIIKGRSTLTVCDRLFDHSNWTVPNRLKGNLMKVGKKNNYPLYSYKPPVYKFRD